MHRWMGTVVVATVVAVGAVVLVSTLTTARSAEPEATPEPAPPADQSYVGYKRCASCHFQEFMKWRKDKHSKTFDLLPAKYQTDPKCVECHSTGYGAPSGFKDIKSTPSLAGTTCEACHGPGSEHEKICTPRAKIKSLSPAQEKQAKDSIWLMRPENVCVKCHVVQAHKENPTPKELRTTK